MVTGTTAVDLAAYCKFRCKEYGQEEIYNDNLLEVPIAGFPLFQACHIETTANTETYVA